MANPPVIFKKKCRNNGKRFYLFTPVIGADDFVLLDAPYPENTDGNESETHVYMHFDSKKDLQTKLEKLLQYLAEKNTPFLMFYSLLAGNNQYAIEWPVGHFLRIAGESTGPYQEYVEHMYLSVILHKFLSNLICMTN